MSGTKGLLDRGGVKAVWPEAPGFWWWLCHSPCSRKEIMQTLWSTLEQSPPPVKNQTKLGALPSWRPGVQESKVKVSPATLPLKALGENLTRLPAPGGGSVGAQKMNFLPPSKLR